MLQEKQQDQLTLFAEDSHVKTYRLPGTARDWMESGLGSGSSSTAFYVSLHQDGLLSRTSLVSLAATEDETLPPSFEGFQNSGICRAGECWTLSFSESPSAAGESLLWQVLEQDVAQKYYLSPRACQGILRRAEKRGRELPENLRQALEASNR